MNMSTINIWAILVAAVVAFVLGAYGSRRRISHRGAGGDGRDPRGMEIGRCM